MLVFGESVLNDAVSIVLTKWVKQILYNVGTSQCNVMYIIIICVQYCADYPTPLFLFFLFFTSFLCYLPSFLILFFSYLTFYHTFFLFLLPLIPFHSLPSCVLTHRTIIQQIPSVDAGPNNATAAEVLGNSAGRFCIMFFGSALLGTAFALISALVSIVYMYICNGLHVCTCAHDLNIHTCIYTYVVEDIYVHTWIHITCKCWSNSIVRNIQKQLFVDEVVCCWNWNSCLSAKASCGLVDQVDVPNLVFTPLHIQAHTHSYYCLSLVHVWGMITCTMSVC